MTNDPLSLMPDESPLVEATPDSIDELLDRINNHLAAGLPEKVTNESLMKIVEAYRAQAVKWTAEVAETGRAPRGRKKAEKPDHSDKALDL